MPNLTTLITFHPKVRLVAQLSFGKAQDLWDGLSSKMSLP
jgi:hypothetical protein